jgi:hypothetical protein
MSAALVLVLVVSVLALVAELVGMAVLAMVRAAQVVGWGVVSARTVRVSYLPSWGLTTSGLPKSYWH